MKALFKPGRVYVLPTGYGVLLGALLLATLSGLANYNNNLGFLVTFLLAAIAFVSLVHTASNISDLHVTAAAAAPVFAGEDARFEFRVETGRRSRMGVAFSFAGGFPVFADLEAGCGNHVVVRQKAGTRGLLRPGLLRVSSRFPLGLFRAWLDVATGAEALVYPRPLPPLSPPNSSAELGEGEGNAEGPGSEDFEGLRPYRPGDTFRDICWRTYSKGIGLHVREFSAEAGGTVLLDWSRLEHADPETKLSWLCSLVLKANGSGSAYGLALPGIRIEPARGARQRHRCLKALALFAPLEGFTR